MRVVVNMDFCESNGMCEDQAPDVFEIRDDDLLYVLNENPGAELRAQVESAVYLCPKQAIQLIETD